MNPYNDEIESLADALSTSIETPDQLTAGILYVLCGLREGEDIRRLAILASVALNLSTEARNEILAMLN